MSAAAPSWAVTVRTESAEGTRAVAAALAGHCGPGDVVLLVGGLGAGKTTFAQGFARGLGIAGPVTSPTFTLVRQYPVPPGGPVDQLVHADVYRLETLGEVADLGLAELLESGAAGEGAPGERAVALVEWGDVAARVLGDAGLTVTLRAGAGDGPDPAPDPDGPEPDPDHEARELTVSGRGEWWAARRDEVTAALAAFAPAAGGARAVIVLGIECATELVGVAVADEDGPRASVWATGARRHGEALAPAVRFVLEQAGTSLGELGAVAVDLGPGLFTSLRVGVATAKGLAQGLGLGVVGVTSVEVLARAAFDAGWPGEVVAVVDARRREVFAARYTRDPNGAVTEVSPPSRYLPDQLAGALAAEAPGSAPVLAVGDGARRYGEGLAGVPGLTLAGPSLAAPAPAMVAVVAGERLAAGAVPAEPAAVVPLYLRDADVRINWVERQPAPAAE